MSNGMLALEYILEIGNPDADYENDFMGCYEILKKEILALHYLEIE